MDFFYCVTHSFIRNSVLEEYSPILLSIIAGSTLQMIRPNCRYVIIHYIATSDDFWTHTGALNLYGCS